MYNVYTVHDLIDSGNTQYSKPNQYQINNQKQRSIRNMATTVPGLEKCIIFASTKF